jgi:hypothetical protein
MPAMTKAAQAGVIEEYHESMEPAILGYWVQIGRTVRR